LTPPSWYVSRIVAHLINLQHSTRPTPHNVSVRWDSSIMLLSAALPHPKKFVNASVHHSIGPFPRALLMYWLVTVTPATSSPRVVRSVVHLIVLPKLTASMSTRTARHACATMTTFSLASLGSVLLTATTHTQ
jgi:hypothetical protein